VRLGRSVKLPSLGDASTEIGKKPEGHDHDGGDVLRIRSVAVPPRSRMSEAAVATAAATRRQRARVRQVARVTR
jgi:hypothetical protein